MSPPGHAVVSLAALDVRRKPEHAAELTSQLLVGEVVRLLGSRPGGQWWKIENLTDGYRGWVRGWGLVPARVSRIRSWEGKAHARVRVPVVEVRTGPGRGPMVSPLFLNSRVIPGRRRGRHRPVELPDGRRGWVPVTALDLGDGAVSLVERVLSLLGVPYHWGGRTALGLDCSSFAQLTLAEQGVRLPRDVARQLQATRPLGEGHATRPGDLVFFAAPGKPAGHVGIGLGGAYYAHCRGFVRISSLDNRNPLCDKDLLPQFMGWRRPLGGPG